MILGPLLILIALLLLSASAIFFGLRGRRVGYRGAFCRRCGYDLTSMFFVGPGGSAMPSAAPPSRCPECGRACTGARSTALYRRKRIGWLWLSGAAILRVTLLAMGGAIYFALSGPKAYKHLPNSALLALSRVSLTRESAEIAREIYDRLDAPFSPLTPAERREIGLWVLDRHEEDHFPWSPIWGDVAMLLVVRGDLSLAEYERFRRNSFLVKASIPAIARPNAITPIRLHVTRYRGTTNDDQSLPIWLRRVAIGGRQVWSAITPSRVEGRVHQAIHYSAFMPPRSPIIFSRSWDSTSGIASNAPIGHWYVATPPDLPLGDAAVEIELLATNLEPKSDPIEFVALRPHFVSQSSTRIQSSIDQAVAAVEQTRFEQIEKALSRAQLRLELWTRNPELYRVHSLQLPPLELPFSMVYHLQTEYRGERVADGLLVFDHQEPNNFRCSIFPVGQDAFELPSGDSLEGFSIQLEPDLLLAEYLLPDRLVNKEAIALPQVGAFHMP